MTARVFAVAGAKGGVGKTTTTINLGAAFARHGHAVVAVELDLAMANLVDFLDLGEREPHPTMHEVLAGDADVSDAIYPAADAFAVAPSGTALESFADVDLNELDDVLGTLRANFDVVLLDTGAGLSRETIEPLKHADATVLISTPRVAAVRDAEKTKELVERVGGELAGLVLTKSGTGASPGADHIAEFLDVDLLGHVPEDDAVPKSQDLGEPVVHRYPNSGSSRAYRLIARGLLERTDGVEATRRNAETEARAQTRTTTASDGGHNGLGEVREEDEAGETDETDGREWRARPGDAERESRRDDGVQGTDRGGSRPQAGEDPTREVGTEPEERAPANDLPRGDGLPAAGPGDDADGTAGTDERSERDDTDERARTDEEPVESVDPSRPAGGDLDRVDADRSEDGRADGEREPPGRRAGSERRGSAESGGERPESSGDRAASRGERAPREGERAPRESEPAASGSERAGSERDRTGTDGEPADADPAPEESGTPSPSEGATDDDGGSSLGRRIRGLLGR